MSAWPLHQLLRELRLKVRRELTLELERNDLWVGDEIYIESLRAAQVQGKALAEELVVRHLGRDDYWWLDGSNVFGNRTNRFSTNLPRILSFGFDLGSGMSNSVMNRRCANLCALFNLGISMFDMLCDRAPAGHQQLAKFIQPDALLVLFRDRSAAGRLKKQAEEIKNFELRCVLKIVAGFYFEMHELADLTGNRGEPILDDLLLRAYRAQMIASNWKEEGSASRVAEAARLKSTLPFHVMFRISCLDNGVQPASEELPSFVGEIFRLIDDLVDLPRDLERGHANSVLFEFGLDRSDEGHDSTTYEKVLALLIKRYVADGASRVTAALRKTLKGVDQSCGLGLSILVYARSWLEQRSEQN